MGQSGEGNYFSLGIFLPLGTHKVADTSERTFPVVPGML